MNVYKGVRLGSSSGCFFETKKAKYNMGKMKKIVWALLAAAAVVTLGERAAAQDSGWWIGGRVGYWHDKTGGVSSNSFALAPEAGYDFNAKWSLAGVAGFDYAKVGGQSANVFVIEPYARYKYFNKGSFTLFVDGGFGIAMGDADGFKVGFTPGVAFKISDRFSLLTTIGFLGYKHDYYNGGGDGFGFDFKSSDLRFGFFYAF